MRSLIFIGFVFLAGCATATQTMRGPASETREQTEADKQRLVATKAKIEALRLSKTPIVCVCNGLDEKGTVFGNGVGVIGVVRFIDINENFQIAACQLSSANGGWNSCSNFQVLQ